MSTATETERVVFKCAKRLIPVIAVLYFMNYLDKVNVGFAALHMNADLGMSTTMYGFGAGLFFIGYFIFEVPSNLMLRKFGARIWITRIVITWGAIAGAMAFVQGPVSFYILRFLLGIAEAGFFPGIILYLGFWFPRKQRAKILSIVYAAVPISIVLGAPVSALLIEHGDGLLGMSGWRFMFLAEGTLTLLAGIAGFFFLIDRPSKAKWLVPAERSLLESTIAAEDAVVEETQANHSFRDALKPRVFVLATVYFGVAYGLYALSFFLPQVIKGFEAQFGVDYTLGQIGLITAAPYAVAVIAMLLWSRHSDKTNERTWHVAGPAILGGVAIGVSLLLGSPLLTMIGITVAAIGIFCAIPSFWQIPPLFLTGAAAAGGIGVINSIGNLSGFFGPYISGWLRDATGNFEAGMYVACGFMILAGVLVVSTRNLQLPTITTTVAGTHTKVTHSKCQRRKSEGATAQRTK